MTLSLHKNNVLWKYKFIWRHEIIFMIFFAYSYKVYTSIGINFKEMKFYYTLWLITYRIMWNIYSVTKLIREILIHVWLRILAAHLRSFHSVLCATHWLRIYMRCKYSQTCHAENKRKGEIMREVKLTTFFRTFTFGFCKQYCIHYNIVYKIHE